MHNQYFNTESLKQNGAQMLDLISNLYDNLDTIPVQPNVKPGFLRAQFQQQPYEEGVDFNEILKETKDKIFPGIKQWQHPGFFGYFPSSTSHPTVLADMFASSFHSPGFTWHASPSHTELENIVVDWAAQMFGLPQQFLLKNSGGGTIALSITDAAFTTIHAAKVRKMKEKNISLKDGEIVKFVAYLTEHTFPGFDKCLMLKDIAYVRRIPVYFDHKIQNFLPDIAAFEKMIEEDVANGLIPFWFCATIGTTPTCASDPVVDLSKICQKYKMWVNIDAAYAGVAWICEKFRNYQEGSLECADSIFINCAKNFMVGNIGALTFVRDKKEFTSSFQLNNENQILKNAYSSDDDVVDYKDWMVGFGRRWNSLKLFYVMRSFGVNGLKNHVESKVELANYFESLIRGSDKFEIFTKPQIALVTFRLMAHPANRTREFQNQLNQKLKEKLDENTVKGFITPSQMGDIYFLRLVVNNHNTTKQHIDQFWTYLNECATIIKEQEEKELQLKFQANNISQEQKLTMFDLQELIAFRHDMHRFPEIGYQEILTQKKIIQFLLKKQIQENQIKKISKTGIIVDLVGTGNPIGAKKLVAFRADIDALSIQEENDQLEYKSEHKQTAHSCGHDLHTTCLLGFASLFQSRKDKFPSNRTIRLLFQPNEEGISDEKNGALSVIEEGALTDVDEIYGFHQWPTHTVGHLMTLPGPMMGEFTFISIELIGKGSHGSEPQKAIDPIQISVDFHLKLRLLKEKFSQKKYVLTLPIFQGGERFNVIPSHCHLEGSMRSLEAGLSQEIKNYVINLLEELKQEYKCQYKLTWNICDPVLVNSKKETENILRLGRDFFGQEKIGAFHLPVYGSEDFSNYLLQKPGTFFFLGSGKKMQDTMIHDSKFNANDDLIELASKFWLKIAEDRIINAKD